MKVAFDVKGTLEGPDKVLALYKWFESKGCEMIVWSSVHSFAVRCAEELKLDGEVMSKRDKLDDEDKALNPGYYMDIAVDDDNFSVFDGETVSWLACENLIKVHEIPECPAEFDKTYSHYFTEEKG